MLCIRYCVTKGGLLGTGCGENDNIYGEVYENLSHSYHSRKGELQLTEMHRDIALALLKRLKERELIGDETYISACNSRFFDSKNFTNYFECTERNQKGKGAQNNEY